MKKQFASIVAAILMTVTFVNCETKVSSVTFDKTSLTLNVGSTQALVVTVRPEKATVNEIAWSSDNTGIATVSDKGVVAAISKGTATITVAVTSKDIKQTASCAVEVLIPISSIALSKSELAIIAGDTGSLKATIEPKNADNKNLAWTSSDKEVATVDADGIIKTLRVGAATITASALDGSDKSATCELTVRLPRPKRGDVYVAGTSSGDATLWINGDPISLGKGEARSVFVGGDDIYVAGQGDGYPTLWKNGVAQRLSEKQYGAEAYSVFASGQDVYVAGTESDNAVLWKNGAPQQLNKENYKAEARCVFVSGKDVYVVGWEASGQANNDTAILEAQLGLPLSEGSGEKKTVATFWKNGRPQRLTDGSRNALAYSIYVSGNTVYVVGTETIELGIPCTTIWEDGVPERLSESSLVSRADCVFVSNSDVYVAGTEMFMASLSSIATLWENGTRQRLTTTNVTNNFAEARFVFVANGDVFVAGSEKTGKGEDVAVLWKDGEAQYLGIGKANAIFVK
jgi:hypothetical protein